MHPRLLFVFFLLPLSTPVFGQDRLVKIATLTSSLSSSILPQSIGQYLLRLLYAKKVLTKYLQKR